MQQSVVPILPTSLVNTSELLSPVLTYTHWINPTSECSLIK
jgi:hypothetical protein